MPTPVNAAWPDPELSVGQKCIQIKRKTVWEAKGPALEKFEKEIIKQIKDLLHSHKEHLELGEQISRTVSFHLWMVGREVESAVPTIIFTSRSAKLREKVIKLIKKHDLLDDFPGFALNGMDRRPAVAMGPQLEANDSENFTLADGETTIVGESLVVAAVVGAAIHARGQPVDVCGSLVSTGDGYETTLGGIITVGNQYYGFIALHPRTGFSGDRGDSESIICRDSDLRFDDDSDASSTATASLRRTASLRTAHDSTSTLDLRSYPSRPDEKEVPSNSSSRTSQGYTSLQIPRPAQSLEEPHKIGTLAIASTRSGLHYGIFHIEDPHYRVCNRFSLPMGEYLYPEAVAPEMQEGGVWIAAGKSGIMSGTIIRNPYFIKLAGSEDYQKMWPIQLERDIMPGDCGSWVIDAVSGNLLGHVVAGDSTLHRAYLIQAVDVLADIEISMNASVLLPTRSSTARTLSAKAFVDRVASIAKQTSLNSLYPGQHYTDLVRFLMKAPKLEIPVAPRHNHVILYELEGTQEHVQVQSQFEDPAEFGRCIDAKIPTEFRRCTAAKIPMLPGRLVFLKGFSSPQWLSTLGALFNVNPDFFHQHLNFMTDRQYFELPTLKSSTSITLRMTTLGRTKIYPGNTDAWRRQCARSMEDYLQSLHRTLETGDSIVRDFSAFDGGMFSIEQDISIHITTRKGTWTVLIWSDIGNSLQQDTIGPWSQPSIQSRAAAGVKLLPLIRPRPGNGLDNQKTISHGGTLDDPHGYWAQGAAILPMAYGQRLNPEVMKCDAFYALHELFSFAAASESQFLNMLETQADNISRQPLVANKNSVSDLVYLMTNLRRHLQRLEETAATLKKRGGPRWPRAPSGPLRDIADAAIDELLEDYQGLAERAKMLHHRCETSMAVAMNMVMIEESRRGLTQSDRIGKLTVLAFVYIPLSFTASFFGMNVTTFGAGYAHLWTFFAVSIPLLFTAFMALWLPDPKRLDQTFRKKGQSKATIQA
ncbi:uncharacterized protein PAC_15986 [Phialocephala subalpina]|uniref:Uncharacterized protein n=1 Tax=Phialocephala subalpina TaxID=576137 RepID=A0A1L7XM03_9HELO|nr:uncharacterized protein PAC_15986 [Phialocephala subalpina]